MITEFEIDRSKWRYGGSVFDGVFGLTYLKNVEGMMCCLGFYSLACGVPEEKLVEVVRPFHIQNIPDHKETFGEIQDYDVQNILIRENDAKDMYPDVREKILTKMFKDVGVKVTFTGEYPKVE